MSDERRFSITPLVEAMRLGPDDSVSRALGISGASLTTYATCGVDERTADRLAARAGFVSWSIWPELLDAAMAEVERECEAPDCTERFVPPARVPHKRFCSKTCKSRTQRRRKYREDPEFRARVIEGARRYYQETRDYQRARQQRVRDAERERRERKAA